MLDRENSAILRTDGTKYPFSPPHYVSRQGFSEVPITEVTMVRICGKCRMVVETFTVKKDNLRLFSDQSVWCPNCNEDQPEVLDVAGRGEAIEREQASYPENRPAR